MTFKKQFHWSSDSRQGRDKQNVVTVADSWHDPCLHEAQYKQEREKLNIPRHKDINESNEFIYF